MAAATDQIRQMVNFILQEAHEKANEIRVKVCCSVSLLDFVTDLFLLWVLASARRVERQGKRYLWLLI